MISSRLSTCSCTKMRAASKSSLVSSRVPPGKLLMHNQKTAVSGKSANMAFAATGRPLHRSCTLVHNSGGTFLRKVSLTFAFEEIVCANGNLENGFLTQISFTEGDSCNRCFCFCSLSKIWHCDWVLYCCVSASKTRLDKRSNTPPRSRPHNCVSIQITALTKKYRTGNMRMQHTAAMLLWCLGWLRCFLASG